MRMETDTDSDLTEMLFSSSDDKKQQKTAQEKAKNTKKRKNPTYT